ncbi:MAG TPA: hypothetical protein VHF69_14895, partial [Candidatus Synoicihabitans sp.]|nr:hypothetical protein [Candidatus Synoicihabitans sp.]
FDRAVTAAIAKVTPRLRNLGAAAEYLETIAEFLGREMKSGRPASNDLQTAFSITARAQNLLKF